ncbi:LrgB-like family-domain-containing protein [Xylogone sp. PMI_703]|nr:LrgB-like family-domain-containing protein [Xylogone sp. PMI_703]
MAHHVYSHCIEAIADACSALQLVVQLSWHRILTQWLVVPAGVICILLVCFGVDSLISLSSVTFPASVACLVVLFLALIACDMVIGDRKTRALANVIDVPAGWSLRWINCFFVPSFVVLPLGGGGPITGAEIGKIIAVMLSGFVVMVAVMAWMVRGLQLLTGSSKRALTERAEEVGKEDDEIPLSEPRSHAGSNPPIFSPFGSDTPTELVEPERTQDPSRIRGTGGPPEQGTVTSRAVMRTMLQAPLPLTRPQRWAAFLNSNFDRIVYSVLFLFVCLPIYYATGYAMPAHLTLTVLAYLAALDLPPRWRQFLHPVLVSAGITIIGVWVLGLIRGAGLDDSLTAYKTGTRYIQLWRGVKGPNPGAADILSTVLDAAIVALALPMFQYRMELKNHFVAIVLPNVVVSIGSLFGYPAFCYAIGISAKRSIAFAGRSLTLALATPAVSNLGGDINTVAPLAIISGILGVLMGPKLLYWLRIPEDDYVTRGVTLGGNSSAIATALLLVTDPRAAALSSLSMSLFGIITLALSSVPPIVKAVGSLVDL